MFIPQDRGSGVYLIEHTDSGRCYVGSAVNLERRLKAHVRRLRAGDHHSPKLQAAWNEHGEPAFKATILSHHPDDELVTWEQRALDNLQAARDGFNVSTFAYSVMKGRRHSKDTRQKMRETHLKRPPISEETRERHRAASVLREREKRERGFEVSPATRQKLSKAGKGRPWSAAQREKIPGAIRKFYEERVL